jgi:hypothetical protein
VIKSTDFNSYVSYAQNTACRLHICILANVSVIKLADFNSHASCVCVQNTACRSCKPFQSIAHSIAAMKQSDKNGVLLSDGNSSDQVLLSTFLQHFWPFLEASSVLD